MKITVNAEPKDLSQEKLTITDLLCECNVEMPDMVSVQVNGTFIDRANFAETQVKEGDEVDFLYFMGGGGS